MTVLAVLWWSSLALSLVALVWLAALMAARVFRQKRNVRRTRDRAAVCDACLAVLSGDPTGHHRLSAFASRTGLMSEIVLDLAAMVRGVERDRLIRTLTILGVDRRLCARLVKGDLRGRIATAEALAAFPSSGTLHAVADVYRSTSHAALQTAALSTLIHLGAAPPVERVLADLERLRHSDSLVHRTVLRRLAPSAREALGTALGDRTRRPATRAIIAEALGASGDYGFVQPLIEAATSIDPTIREAVVRALGVLGHPEGSGVARAAFTDVSWRVRAEACDAAARLGARAFASHLNTALADEVWWVRFRAAEALKAAGPLGVATLEVASRSTEDRVRRSASGALAEKAAA